MTIEKLPAWLGGPIGQQYSRCWPATLDRWTRDGHQDWALDHSKWRPCSRRPEAFQCPTPCGAVWLSREGASVVDSCWCPACGKHSAWDVDIEFLMCDEVCGDPSE